MGEGGGFWEDLENQAPGRGWARSGWLILPRPSCSTAAPDQAAACLSGRPAFRGCCRLRSPHLPVGPAPVSTVRVAPESGSRPNSTSVSPPAPRTPISLGRIPRRERVPRWFLSPDRQYFTTPFLLWKSPPVICHRLHPAPGAFARPCEFALHMHRGNLFLLAGSHFPGLSPLLTNLFPQRP